MFLRAKRSPFSIFLTSEMSLKLFHEFREILVLHIRERDGDIFKMNVDDKSGLVFASQWHSRAVSLELHSRAQRVENVLVLLNIQMEIYSRVRAQ